MHKTVRDCGLYVQAAADPVNLMFQEAFESKYMSSVPIFHTSVVIPTLFPIL